jgi:hypothetical protein
MPISTGIRSAPSADAKGEAPGPASALLGSMQLGASAMAGALSAALYDGTAVPMVLTMAAFIGTGAMLVLLPAPRGIIPRGLKRSTVSKISTRVEDNAGAGAASSSCVILDPGLILLTVLRFSPRGMIPRGAGSSTSIAPVPMKAAMVRTMGTAVPS